MDETRKSGRGKRTGATAKQPRRSAAQRAPVKLEAAPSLRPKTARKTAPDMKPIGPATREEWVRIAAYYRAERRGFAPGHDLEDWFAAEAGLGVIDAPARRARSRKPITT